MRGTWSARSMPRARPSSTRAHGGPTPTSIVPAECTMTSDSALPSCWRRNNAADGDRQRLPVQTNSTSAMPNVSTGFRSKSQVVGVLRRRNVTITNARPETARPATMRAMRQTLLYPPHIEAHVARTLRVAAPVADGCQRGRWSRSGRCRGAAEVEPKS